MLNNIKPLMPPAKGTILVSDPFLQDPNFRRTVALICEHNQEGTFGFVLNHKMDIFLDDVINISTIQQVPVYSGGPVQKDTLHFLHRDPEFIDGSVEVLPGVYWGSDFEKVKHHLEANDLAIDNFRFFIGYSGWGDGQLDFEISENSWFVAPASESIVFEMDEEELWKDTLRDMGGAFKVLSNAPESPQMN